MERFLFFSALLFSLLPQAVLAEPTPCFFGAGSWEFWFHLGASEKERCEFNVEIVNKSGTVLRHATISYAKSFSIPQLPASTVLVSVREDHVNFLAENKSVDLSKVRWSQSSVNGNVSYGFECSIPPANSPDAGLENCVGADPATLKMTIKNHGTVKLCVDCPFPN